MFQSVVKATGLLATLCDKYKICPTHGVAHATKVLAHVQRALSHDKEIGKRISVNDEEACLLAALLHDADDSKYWKTNDYSNARMIIRESNPGLESEVVKMISLVSASVNGNNIPGDVPRFYLYPRYADRVEALGAVGIERCWIYTVKKSRPLYNDLTPRPKTEEELFKLAGERFKKYAGDSSTMIDHYYDKLLNLAVDTGNIYLNNELKKGIMPMINLCLEFALADDLNKWEKKWKPNMELSV